MAEFDWNRLCIEQEEGTDLFMVQRCWSKNKSVPFFPVPFFPLGHTLTGTLYGVTHNSWFKPFASLTGTG